MNTQVTQSPERKGESQMFELQFSGRYQWNQKQAQWESAVGQAYGLFAQKYPEWSNSLFDEHFLAQGGVTFAGGWQQLDPAGLASAWDRQLGPAAPAVSQKRVDDLTPAAADFLTWARAAYRTATAEFVLATARTA